MPAEPEKCLDSENGNIYQLPLTQCQVTLITILLNNSICTSLEEALEGHALIHAFQSTHDYLPLVEDIVRKIDMLTRHLRKT
jgi:hypothetical protein